MPWIEVWGPPSRVLSESRESHITFTQYPLWHRLRLAAHTSPKAHEPVSHSVVVFSVKGHRQKRQSRWWWLSPLLFEGRIPSVVDSGERQQTKERKEIGSTDTYRERAHGQSAGWLLGWTIDHIHDWGWASTRLTPGGPHDTDSEPCGFPSSSSLLKRTL